MQQGFNLAPQISHLTKYYGTEPVLKDLSLTFSPTGIFCLMAPSGSGKTTLFRLLLGLEQPDSGTISGFPAGRISAVFQEDRLLDGFTAMENIQFVTGNLYSKKELRALCLRLLPVDSLDKPVCEFSGGMRRRTAILRAILAPAGIVLMDEPFTGLDYETKLSAMSIIREFCAGKLLIAATHAEEDIGLLGARRIEL